MTAQRFMLACLFLAWVNTVRVGLEAIDWWMNRAKCPPGERVLPYYGARESGHVCWP